MSTKANSASFIKWRLDNAEKVLQYKRDYHRKNYERIYEGRKVELHNRYVWKTVASKFRNILVDQ